MSQSGSRVRASLIGMALIAVFLTVLALAPSLTQKTSFKLPEPKTAGASKLALDTPLLLLRRANSGNWETPPGATSLADYAKHPGGTIVNFWATWCPPCIEELPALESLHRQLRNATDPKLPQLVTISVDENPSDVLSFFRTLNYSTSFPVLYDRDGALSRSVGTVKFPETYWISNDGTILHKWVGPQDWVSGEVLKRLAERRGS